MEEPEQTGRPATPTTRAPPRTTKITAHKSTPVDPGSTGRVVAATQLGFQRLTGGQIFTTGNVAVLDTVNNGGTNGVVPLQ